MGTALRHLGSGASNLPDCSLAHASESRDDAGRLSKCAMCGEGMVPNILLATMDFPEGLPIVGRSELVEARVVRLKRKMAGEAHAQDLSEALPYLELELHKQLVHKMRVMGLNAAFGLRVEISHGSQLLLGVATATAVLVPALPRPPVVRAQPSRAPGGKAKPTGRDLVAKTPTSLRVPRQSSRAFRGAQQEAASTGHLSPPSAFGTARSNHPREMPRDNFKLTSKPGSDRRSSSFLMVCPARYRSPQRAWRRWLLRITCGILGEPASGSETYRGDRPMVASCVTFQAARPTCEALEHLNTAVACHLQRRKLDSSPTAADSFDWPTDKLQALQLTQLSLGRQRSAQELEAILMKEKNPGLERDNSKNLRHQDDRPQFLFEVDDEADEDLLMVLDDLLVPDGATLCTVDCPPDGTGIFQGRAPAEVELVGPTHKDGSCSVVYGVRRVDLFEDLGLDRSAVIGSAGVGSVQITAMLTKHLAKVLTEMYACMLFREMVRRGPAICCLAALSWRIAVLEDDVIELVLTGQLLATNAEPGKSTSQISQPSSLPLRPSVELQASQPAAVHAISEGPRGTTTNELLWHTLHLKQFRSHEPLQSIESEPPRDEGCHRRSDQEWVPDASVAEADKPVLVSALSSIPNCEVEQYCGFVTVHMIKETVNVTRQFESLQVFYHQFVAEALLTAKAHVLAVGGDALLGYRINNLFLREDKRRAYAVISISGDAAKLGFDPLPSLRYGGLALGWAGPFVVTVKAGARVKELQRIDAENQRLLKRLQGTKAAVNMSKLDKEHKVRAASKALPPPARMPRTPRAGWQVIQVLRQASCRSPRESKLEERVVRRAATGVELMGPKSGRTKARSKPKVAPTRAPKQRPSKAARSDELGAKSRAGPRRQRKRKAEEAEPEEFEDPDEDSWSCGHDEPETVSEDDSED
ncbi:unnamed protein product [Durusdinium trenchii]|uniref:Uncharacterized protein n=1 Tax=Durusdinium trenchii TaxID=1381693 RepID=A0ABP0N5V8_9DINO